MQYYGRFNIRMFKCILTDCSIINFLFNKDHWCWHTYLLFWSVSILCLDRTFCSVLIYFRMKRNRNLCRLGLLFVKSCYHVLLDMGLHSSCVRMMFLSCAMYVGCLTLISQRKLLTPSQTNLFSASIQKPLSDTRCEVIVSYYFSDIMLTYY